MSDTRDKLDEAAYFLERMIQVRDDRRIFAYNLSAFLSSFRSITYIMQVEFSGHQNFREWYAIEQEGMKADTKMRLLHDKRIATVHTRLFSPLGIKLVASFPLTKGDWAIEVVNEDESMDQVEEPPTQRPKIGVQNWYFTEIPGADVIAACQECLDKMRAIVDMCEQKFAVS